MIGYHGVTSDGTMTLEFKSRDQEFQDVSVSEP